MKRFLVLISMFVISSAFGQQNCSCDKALDNLIAKIESEYPGFGEKTKDTILYNSFKKQLREEAKSTEEASCFKVLKKYTSFFKDRHIWLSPVIALNDKGFDTSEFIDVDMDKFSKDSKSEINSIEGIWVYSPIENDEVDYKVGITKTKNDEYTGFALPSTLENSKSKRVLFKLSSNDKYESYFPDKYKHIGGFEIYDNTFLYFKEIGRTLIKEGKTLKTSEKQIEKKVGEIQGFRVRQLSKKTVSITLPSFDYPFVEIINNLIEENNNLIENSENLIIDVRGNSGGTGIAYQKLLPYIMTNSIRWMGIEFLATQTLVDGLEGYIETVKDDKEKQGEIERIREDIIRYKNNMGQFVNINDNSFSVQEINYAEKSPKNVIILTDNLVGSSAENLVMASKQSKKVKVLGTVTSGSLDYAAARQFDFGCPEYNLHLPTYRSLRLPDYPIDNIGLQPDIYLDKSIKDWVKYAVDYLEN